MILGIVEMPKILVFALALLLAALPMAQAVPSAFVVALPLLLANHPQPTPTLEPIEIATWMSDPNPARYSTVTVYSKITRGGVGIPGVPMDTAWHYRTATSHCSGLSGADGVASCSRNIGAATAGYHVQVDVEMTYGGQTYYASTGFTPR